MSDSAGQNALLERPMRSRSTRLWLLLGVVAIGCASISETVMFDSRVLALPTDPRNEMERTGPVMTEALATKMDFSKFTHSAEAHSRLPCLLCHRRDSNASQPKLPGHAPCTGCHVQEFANSGSPICSICHTNAQAGAVKSFPRLKSFNVKFDHAGHIGTGRSSSKCATCHKPERRGVSLSIPIGLGGHTTCFQCHAPNAVGRNGQDIASCSTCHSLAGYARTPEGSKAYKINFSHAIHGTAKKLNCSSCHSIRAGMPQRRQVTSTVPVMHAASGRSQSCASCHDDKRAFGIANASDCKRCHQGTTWRM